MFSAKKGSGRPGPKSKAAKKPAAKKQDAPAVVLKEVTVDLVDLATMKEAAITGK